VQFDYNCKKLTIIICQISCLQVEEKPLLPEHEPLSTSETVSDETVKEVHVPEIVRPKLSEEPALFTALKIREPAVVHEVDQVLDQVELAEFGPAEWPLRELATIDILTRHGISTEQVIANRNVCIQSYKLHVYLSDH